MAEIAMIYCILGVGLLAHARIRGLIKTKDESGYVVVIGLIVFVFIMPLMLLLFVADRLFNKVLRKQT